MKKGCGVVAAARNNDNMSRYAPLNKYGSFDLANAFWQTSFDIYVSLVVDDLHQLGGVYRHLLRFTEELIQQQRGKTAIVEQRCRSLPYYTGMKNFKSVFLLSSLTNPSFGELRKHMQLVLCLVYDLIPLQCALCLRAFIDFFVQINSKEHTQSTLSAADHYLKRFFDLLPAFQHQSTMQIPKLHMLTHYKNDITMKGPLDGYTTMNSER